jgi:hypothetical protein
MPFKRVKLEVRSSEKKEIEMNVCTRKLTTATRNAPFKFAQASQQAFVCRKGNHLGRIHLVISKQVCRVESRITCGYQIDLLVPVICGTRRIS